MSTPAAGLSTSRAILVDFGEARPQRRLSVFFRVILAIPQFFLLGLLGVGAFFVVVYAWFGALIRGRAPRSAANFLLGYLRRLLRLNAYLYLLTDVYPPLDSSADYPADLTASPGPLNRLAVLFRVVLIFPAALLSGLLSSGMLVFSALSWLIVVVSGRLPRTIFGANSLAIRYSLRVVGYALLLSSEWPWGAFGDRVSLEDPPLPSLSTPLGPGPSAWSTSVTDKDAPEPRRPTTSLEALYTTLSAPSDETSAIETTGASTPSRSWTLAPTRGARVLLAIYLVLGIAYQAVVRPTNFRFSSTASAIGATETAVTALNSTLTSTNTRALECPATARRLVCLTTVLRDQARAYARLDQALLAISYPSAVSVDAAGMEADAAKDAVVYAALARQTSLAAISALASASQGDLTTSQTDFNTRYLHMRTLLVTI